MTERKEKKMNKLFSKIATLSVGLAMAIGVGVAVGSKNKNVSSAIADGEVTVTKTVAELASSLSWNSGTQYKKWNLDSVVVVENHGENGANSGKYYSTSPGTWRCYTSDTITISTSMDYTIDSITLTLNGGSISGVTSGTPFDVNSSSWTCSALSETVKISAFSVTYHAGGSGGDEPVSSSGQINFGSASGSLNVNSASVSGDDDNNITWNVTTEGTTSFTPNAAYAQIGSGSKPASSITFTASLGGERKITDFSAKFGGFNGTAGSVALKVGSATVGSGSLSGTSDVTINASDKTQVGSSLTVTVTNISKGVKAYYISYTMESSTTEKLVIKLNQSQTAPFEITYDSTAYMFYAYDSEGVVNADWTVGDSTILSVTKNANNVALVSTLKAGETTLTASAEGYTSSTVSVTVLAGTVTSLSISGSMSKTEYYAGTNWSYDGFTVTATYSTGYQEIVTSKATWTYNPASPELNVNSVVATASFGGQSVSSGAQSVTVTRANPIQLLYTLSDSSAVDVYGYYVGFADGTGPIIMDGEYGIVCYDKSADVSGYTEGETVLHVTGSMATYKGLRQVGSPSLSIASGTYDEPDTPVVYSTKGGETVEYASRLTTVTGVATCTVNDFSGEAGAKDITMSFDLGGGKSVQVFYKKAAQEADTASYATMKAKVAASESVTVKGFTGWYNGFQVQMNAVVEEQEDYTAEQFAQDLLDQTHDLCAAYVDGESDYNSYKSQLTAIWSNLASADKYPSLPGDQKTILAEAERDESGTVVEQAMARYDFLTGKYELNNFINGRTPMSILRVHNEVATDNNNVMIVIIAISITSILATSILLAIKKRKHN